MADLPRWEDRNDLDSAACYAAYTEVAQRFPNVFMLPGLLHLHMIVHKAPSWFSMPSSLVDQVRCSDATCRRCRLQLGGYSFRWMHQLWTAKYSQLQRPGSYPPAHVRNWTVGVEEGSLQLIYQCIRLDRDIETESPRRIPEIPLDALAAARADMESSEDDMEGEESPM